MDTVRTAFGAKFTPEPDRDLFIGSYPRSGNTWLRAIVFHLEFGEDPKSLRELDFAVPDGQYPIAKRSLRSSRRYIVKTHLPYRREYKRALYVVRNPVASLESFYRYIEAISEQPLNIETFALDTVAGRIWPGSWSENVLSWTTIPSHFEAVWVVRYEDLRQGSSNALEKVAEFLGSDPDNVASAFARFDFQRMKNLEATGNRPALEKRRTGWFVAGNSNADNQAIILDAMRRHRPEMIAIASHFGYELD